MKKIYVLTEKIEGEFIVIGAYDTIDKARNFIVELEDGDSAKLTWIDFMDGEEWIDPTDSEVDYRIKCTILE